jgi:hypothetical protein
MLAVAPLRLRFAPRWRPWQAPTNSRFLGFIEPGKAVPVKLEAQRFNCYDNPMLKARVCGGDFETTIRRSQWGMSWGIDMGVPDAVRLLIQIEAVRQ